jgi:hypothetical protein
MCPIKPTKSELPAFGAFPAPGGVIGYVEDGRGTGCTDFGLQFRRNRLFLLMPNGLRFAKFVSIINASGRTLTPRILVRIQVPQPIDLSRLT